MIEASARVATGRELVVDCILDTILSENNTNIWVKLTDLVIQTLKSKSRATPFRNSGLHLLNKLTNTVPSLDDLHPIMVSSPVVKLIEAIVLKDLNSKLEKKIDIAEVGFFSTLNT